MGGAAAGGGSAPLTRTVTFTLIATLVPSRGYVGPVLVGRARHVVSVIISIFECDPTLLVQQYAFGPTTMYIFLISCSILKRARARLNFQYAPFSFTNHLPFTPVAVLCITKSGSRSKSTITYDTVVTRDVHTVYPTHGLLLDRSMDVRTVLRPAASRASELCGLG